MRIGVVVPTYNRPGLTLETLESIAAQTRAPDQVVVVDDCSTDDTAASIEAWIRQNADNGNWSLRRQPSNGGVAAARNRGVEQLVDCDILGFLDSDDLWPVDLLARAESMFSGHPDVAAAFVDRSIEESLRDRPDLLESYDRLALDPIAQLIRQGCPTPSSTLVTRRAFEAAGGFDPRLRYHEDLALFLRIARTGTFGHLVGEPIRYRLGLANKIGEAGAATQSFHDRALMRARVVDAFDAESRSEVPRHLHAWGWFRAARSAYRQGRWRESRKRAARALRLAPWYPRPAWTWIGATLRQMFDRRGDNLSS